MLKKYLYEQILKYLYYLNDNDVYVISILIINDEESIYRGITHFPKVYITHNTEHNCECKSNISEERWNIAYWHNTKDIAIIDYIENIKGAELLYEWYFQNQITDIGFENPNSMYDEEMNYIGKGAKGYWELFTELSLVVKQIRQNHDLEKKIHNIPIVIHDYEYSWYIERFINIANPNNQAAPFLEYYRNYFDV